MAGAGASVADLLRQRYGGDDLASATDMTLPTAVADLLGRRTCRAFDPAAVPAAHVSVLLAASQSAPTKSNLQQYSIVRVTDTALRSALGDLVPSMPWIVSAPEFWVYCGDVRRIRRLADLRGHAYRNDNADTFMNACVDAAVATMACIAAAEALGYGICPISYIRNRIEDAAELLRLPEGVFPVVGLCVGRPVAESDDRPVSVRLPPALVLHENRYDDSALEAEIGAYDERAHARQPIAPDKQRHTDRYGVLDRCPWSENVARQLSLPEREGFAAFLKRQGISLD